MSIIDKLSSSLGRMDQVPNQELARKIAENKDKQAVQEIMDGLMNGKSRIQGDCIKVVYEIGEIAPELIASHYKDFIKLLDHKNNRLQWGAMSALETIALLQPEAMYANLPKLIEAAEKGSVITKDNLMSILVKLGGISKYAENAFDLYNEQLKKSLTNQLPKYAEDAMVLVNDGNRKTLLATLRSRVSDVETPTKLKRLEKVIAKLTKQLSKS